MDGGRSRIGGRSSVGGRDRVGRRKRDSGGTVPEAERGRDVGKNRNL